MEKPIYKITIEMERYEKAVRSTEYQKVRTESEAALASDDGKAPGIYGWTPEVIETTKVQRTIYTQEVTDLDLKAVIDAVNAAPRLKDVFTEAETP